MTRGRRSEWIIDLRRRAPTDPAARRVLNRLLREQAEAFAERQRAAQTMEQA